MACSPWKTNENIPSKSPEKPVKNMWNYHEKFHWIFMDFNFIVNLLLLIFTKIILLLLWFFFFFFMKIIFIFSCSGMFRHRVLSTPFLTTVFQCLNEIFKRFLASYASYVHPVWIQKVKKRAERRWKKYWLKINCASSDSRWMGNRRSLSKSLDQRLFGGVIQFCFSQHRARKLS